MNGISLPDAQRDRPGDDIMHRSASRSPVVHLTQDEEVKPVAYYWVAVNGRQVGLPFDNLEAAKKLLLKHVGEEAALSLIEVYRRDQPMQQLIWDSEALDWIEVSTS